FSIQVTGVPERALAALGRSLEPSAILTMPVYFPVIPGGAMLEESVDVKFDRRGAQRQNSFVFTTRFPFGFLDKIARVTLPREVLVYPSIEPQPGRSEERRVGKECRCRRWQGDEKKKRRIKGEQKKPNAV